VLIQVTQEKQKETNNFNEPVCISCREYVPTIYVKEM